MIELGIEMFRSRCVPVLVGAPALGRYCVFGNLFARFGADGEIFRLDRHPSMSRHPVTPMHEADLRLHLAKQTTKKIGLLDVLELDRAESLDPLLDLGNEIILIDLLREDQLAAAGRLIEKLAPVFVVGSSGVESALAADWGRVERTFDPVRHVGPIIALCGSCSPVTTGQIQWAVAHGFAEIILGDEVSTIESALQSIRAGKSVVIHSNAAQRLDESSSRQIGAMLGRILREILQAAPIRRAIIAGGDTSGQIARMLEIESMEMIGELTRGSPLCKIAAPGSPADGIEMTFKGGQIGPENFFGVVQKGSENSV